MKTLEEILKHGERIYHHAVELIELEAGVEVDAYEKHLALATAFCMFTDFMNKEYGHDVDPGKIARDIYCACGFVGFGGVPEEETIH